MSRREKRGVASSGQAEVMKRERMWRFLECGSWIGNKVSSRTRWETLTSFRYAVHSLIHLQASKAQHLECKVKGLTCDLFVC